jgi:transposase
MREILTSGSMSGDGTRSGLRSATALTLDFLPPYSPELNPTERIWELTRRLCVHNRYFHELDDVALAVETGFVNWTKPNDTLHRVCAIT